MAAVKWTQEQLNEIDRIQEQRNLTRKGAVQYYSRQQKRDAAARPAGPEGMKQFMEEKRPKTVGQAVAAAVNKDAKTAAKPKRERKPRANKGVVSTGLIAVDLRLPLVTKMHKAGKSRKDIAVALGWTPGNGYGMVKALLIQAGAVRKYEGARREAK